MSDATTSSSSNTILGFDVSAVLSVGDPSSRQQVDISHTLSEVNFCFMNYAFVPVVFLTFLIDAKYITSMSNPYELDLTITEKGLGTTPRSVLSGKFFSLPERAPVTYIQDSSRDLMRFQIKEPFYPIDVAKTLNKENSVVVSSGTVTDALNKAFNASVTGGCKLKLGTFSNSKTYSQIILPWGKLQAHFYDIIGKYGLTDLGLIAYSDFSNIYVHTVNDTLVGDSTPITMFFGNSSEKSTDNNIANYHYYTRMPPQIKSVSGLTQEKYSGDVTTITYPRSGGYNVSTVNMKSTAKKMKNTDKTDVFNYYDLYKTSQTEIHQTADTSYPIQGRLANASTSSYDIVFYIDEPFSLADFVIGRSVKFDSSVSEYLGLEMTGYVDTADYVLSSNARNRWMGLLTLTVKCASNSSAVK